MLVASAAAAAASRRRADVNGRLFVLDNERFLIDGLLELAKLVVVVEFAHLAFECAYQVIVLLVGGQATRDQITERIDLLLKKRDHQ